MQTVTSLLSVLTVVAGLVVLPACDLDNDCVTGQGAPVSQQIDDPGAFTSIRTDNSIDVRVTSGNVASVTVTAPANIIPEVRAVVSNTGELAFDFTGNCYRNANVVVDIVTPTLFGVIGEGSGNFDLRDLDVTVADFSVSGDGSGDFTLTNVSGLTALSVRLDGSGGITATNVDSFAVLLVELDGSGDADLFAAAARTATVAVEGSGGAEVTVARALDATIRGSGDISYRGLPIITLNDAGSGDLINAN